MKKEDNPIKCEYCGKDAVYRCSVCRKMSCEHHVRLRTICSSCFKKTKLPCKINSMKSDGEKRTIQEFVKRFWGEEEQIAFDRKFIVAKLPVYIAKADESVIGFISFSEMDDAIIIIALGMLPKYQNANIGRSLIANVQNEAKKLKKKIVGFNFK